MIFQKIKKEAKGFSLLLRSVPALTVTVFILSVFSMNLLANKSVSLPFEWLALDCGIIVSWVAFLAMDVITMHFGPKGATQISLLAVFINLVFCFVFFAASRIPGAWGESYIPGSEDILNTALNNTFGGTWYVLFGSTVAFTVSAFVNNFMNYAIGKLFSNKKDGFAAYISRTYISTAVGQFCDNIIFALIVSHFFFGWTLLQCVTCAITGMCVELLCEVVFSFFGFKVCEKWKRENIGKEYLDFMRSE